MTVHSFTQFRVEPQSNGIVHLVFDCVDRTMNVFSNAAITNSRNLRPGSAALTFAVS